ncbi:hypothetical protein ACFWY6_12635 [Streptomyces sp. NPDC059037]|uniref:hypothetical protein n=1 Tax=Streptomyces sp. NPDC059037 TaxID=3346710 RepID=UPI0036CBD07D
MKVEVILRTKGQPEAVVGEAEGDTWPEIRRELPKLMRNLADEFENTMDDQEVPDVASDV